MIFDWSEYLELARTLTTQAASLPDKEAALRAAISRAYYAAFCRARNHLRDRDNVQNIVMLHGGSHADVINTFRSSRNQARQRVGSGLSRLRTDRVHADYYDEWPAGEPIERKAQQAILLAEQLIRSLEQLPPP